jgi:signal transduction histidine kinase/CheY-like chemotaxis protein
MPRRGSGWWRSLPLTAQLLAVGMLVSLAWFLVARATGERIQADARTRFTEIERLRRAEVVGTRLGSSIVSMSRAHRGYLLSGDDTYLVDVATARAALEVDALRLLESTSDFNVRQDLAEVLGYVRRWEVEVFRPNVARRRAQGIRAFETGTAGAAGVRKGAALMDSANAAQERTTRDIREQMAQLQLLEEEAVAEEEWLTFLIWTAALTIFVLLLTLLMRLVARALNQVIGAATALDQGRYAAASLPSSHLAPNREMARLAVTFEKLALSIAMRERQLQEDIEKLKELERLKRDFVSTVSHELRTPLTSIRGALSLVVAGKVGEIPPKGLELLKIAVNNTERLIRLINDILDIEKMDAGQVTTRRDRLRLRPLIETTLAGLEGLAATSKVGLHLEPGPDTDLIGDADRLVQVFTNLVSNAVKFSPQWKSVELSIVLRRGEVTVRVRDHGPGIPEEFAKRIFGRFQQAGGADSRKSGGTGLGLNIAKAIVDLHQGSVGFEPAEGGGTVFWVTLPTVPPLAPGADQRVAVMIIEDDASMRDVLVAQCETIARPVPAQSAEAALDLLERERVGAIILDPGLPGMDGLAFAQRLRKDARLRSLPIFLFSAREYSAEELRGSGIRAADAFVKTRDAEGVLFERLKHELAKHH